MASDTTADGTYPGRLRHHPRPAPRSCRLVVAGPGRGPQVSRERRPRGAAYPGTPRSDTLGDCADRRGLEARPGSGRGGATGTDAGCAAASCRRECRCTGPGRSSSTTWCSTRWPGSSHAGRPSSPAWSSPSRRSRRPRPRRRRTSAAGPDRARLAGHQRPGPPGHARAIVVYRRPLMARADDDDELSDLVFDVVVEEFADFLGLDPEIDRSRLRRGVSPRIIPRHPPEARSRRRSRGPAGGRSWSGRWRPG